MKLLLITTALWQGRRSECIICKVDLNYFRFRWEHTSWAAICLHACTLGPEMLMQLGVEVNSLMPPQGKLNPTDDSREKSSTLRDVSFVLVFSFWVSVCLHSNTKQPTSNP